MLMQRSFAITLTHLSRVLPCPTVLHVWTPKTNPLKARRYMATSGLQQSDSSRLSSPTDDPATRKDSHPSKRVKSLEPDPALPVVEFNTPKGRVRRNVQVSAKTSADMLVKALSPLLSAHTSNIGSTKSVGSKGWHLRSDGATIVRYFAFENEADATKFVDSVRVAVDEMNHHPEIFSCVQSTNDTTPVKCVAIACSTHRPPGLSMRDIRLARKVDELAEPFNYMAHNTDVTLRNALWTIRRSLVRQLKPKKRNTMISSEAP